MFCGKLSNGRAGLRGRGFFGFGFGFGRGFGGCSGCNNRGTCSLLLRGGCRRLARWLGGGLGRPGAALAGVDHAQDLVALHVVTGLPADGYELAALGRRDLQDHLVRFDVDQLLAFLHRIARLFQPGPHHGLGDRFGQLRNRHVHLHARTLLDLHTGAITPPSGRVCARGVSRCPGHR